MYNTRSGLWQQEHARYVKRECKESRAQKNSNLTLPQQLALERLKKKVSKLQLIVLEADKGKWFVIVDEMTYLAMSRDHIEKDMLVTPSEVTRAQREATSTAKALSTILGLGRGHPGKNHNRCHDNAGSWAEDAPILKLLPKVHKDLSPTRPPTFKAGSGSSQQTDIEGWRHPVGPIIHMETPRYEDKSTEEALSQLAEAQTGIRKAGSKEAMVGSLDVKSLYPSLDQEGAAEMVSQLVLRSRMKFPGVDYRAAQVYLASTLDEEMIKKESLQKLLPARMHRKGKRPGATTDELSVKLPEPRVQQDGGRV